MTFKIGDLVRSKLTMRISKLGPAEAPAIVTCDNGIAYHVDNLEPIPTQSNEGMRLPEWKDLIQVDGLRVYGEDASEIRIDVVEWNRLRAATGKE